MWFAHSIRRRRRYPSHHPNQREVPCCHYLSSMSRRTGASAISVAFLPPPVGVICPLLLNSRDGASRHTDLHAIRSHRPIAIVGDYDCDGVLSTAILEATLCRLGAQPTVYLPHRDEGYGLTNEVVHRATCHGDDWPSSFRTIPSSALLH
jgi:hypothetical protein